MHHPPRQAMLTLLQARARLLDTLSGKTSYDIEMCNLPQAYERTLAQDMVAPFDVPLATNSAMDGFALRSQDFRDGVGQLWPVVGVSLAGHPFNGEIPVGACIRITTGALVPAELDAVVMQEDTLWANPQQQSILVHQVPKTGQHIRLKGNELSQGQVVLRKGTKLGPLQLGLLATLGIESVAVFRQVRVGVLSTGDELKQPGACLAAGELYDSNRPMLLAVCQRLGLSVVDLGWVGDDADALRQRLLSAATQVDVIISSGGVSVGHADFTRQVFSELGSIDFWQVAVKPGKPFAFGWLNPAAQNHTPVWLFGLPGNPVSAALTFEQLVVPALQYLSGQTPAEPALWPAHAGAPFKKKPGRLDLQRVMLNMSAQGIAAHPIGSDSSAMLSSWLHADGLVWLEQERADVDRGDAVLVQLKSAWWR